MSLPQASELRFTGVLYCVSVEGGRALVEVENNCRADRVVRKNEKKKKSSRALNRCVYLGREYGFGLFLETRVSLNKPKSRSIVGILFYTHMLWYTLYFNTAISVHDYFIKKKKTKDKIQRQ